MISPGGVVPILLPPQRTVIISGILFAIEDWMIDCLCSSFSEDIPFQKNIVPI